MAEDWSHGADEGCLKHPNVRSVADGQGPDAGKLEALAATHKKNQSALAEAGFNNTFVGSIRPTRTLCGRQQTKKKSRLGTINSKLLWIVCKATALIFTATVCNDTLPLAKHVNFGGELPTKNERPSLSLGALYHCATGKELAGAHDAQVDILATAEVLKSDLFTLALEADLSMAAVTVHSLIESAEPLREVYF
jgi:hypothetical protein